MMHRSAILAWGALALAGCGSAAPTSEEQRAQVFLAEAPSSGPSAAQDVEQLEAWSGKKVTLVGMFDHLHFQHGVIRLASGLKVYLPHFDHFMEGEDWFRYVGQRCYATGILHTYTKDIDGFRGPSLELNDFSGP